MREMRIQPVTLPAGNTKPVVTGNQFWNTSNRGTGSPAGTQAYDSATKTFVSTVTTAATGNAYTIRYTTTLTGRTPVIPGARYYHRVEVMSTVDDYRALAIDIYNAGGGAVSGATENPGVRQFLPAGVWVTFEQEVVIPAGGIYADLGVIYTGATGGNPTIRPVGSELRARNLMFVQTTINPNVKTMPYVDGDSAGFRWIGAPDSSPAVGWPYTLESIAGSPVAQITGLGSVPLTTSEVPALAGRTIYVVTDRLALPGTGVAARFARGVQVQGGADLRSDGPSARYTYRPQYDGGGGGAGGTYSTGYIANVPVAGTRNIHAVAEMDGLTSYEHEVNGGVPVVKTGMVPGSGHTLPGLYTELGTDGTTTCESPVYAAMFLGGHSAETRKRVTAWLARKYGAPIPAGY